MARTITEIKKEMTDAFMADTSLQQAYGFDTSKTFSEQFSKVSIESILFYIVAASIWVLEVLFDKHQEEVGDIISKRAHTLAWYRERAFAFQYGYDLREDVAEYDNSGLTDEQVEASRIVKKCSCESVDSVFPSIKIKVATAQGAMDGNQLDAFTAYIGEIADAGVKVAVVSRNPDKLGLSMTVVYDPLIMNSRGYLYNEGVENVVEKYIDDYLSGLEYNGDFYPNMLESYLMRCPGVKVANITAAWVKPDGENAANITGKLKHSPTSGAFEFDNFIAYNLTITYKPFGDDEQYI